MLRWFCSITQLRPIYFIWSASILFILIFNFIFFFIAFLVLLKFHNFSIFFVLLSFLSTYSFRNKDIEDMKCVIAGQKLTWIRWTKWWWKRRRIWSTYFYPNDVVYNLIFLSIRFYKIILFASILIVSKERVRERKRELFIFFILFSSCFMLILT